MAVINDEIKNKIVDLVKDESNMWCAYSIFRALNRENKISHHTVCRYIKELENDKKLKIEKRSYAHVVLPFGSKKKVV